MMTRWSHALFALLIAFAVTLSVPAKAQKRDPAYDDLVAAINESVDKDAAMDNIIVFLKNTYAEDPTFAELEAESPGFLDDLMVEFRPIFERRVQRQITNFNGQMAELLARNMTVEEAAGLASVFRSDAVKRFNQRVSQAYSPDNTLSSMDPDDPITADQVRADAQKATATAIRDASPAELAEVERQGQASPGLKILGRLRPQLAAMRAALDNEPPTPEEEAEMDAAIERVLDKRFPPAG
jgi:hypothetical protein